MNPIITKVFKEILFNPVGIMVFAIMPLLMVIMLILENREYRKTYAKLPRFLWPTKTWWKQNKGYARAMMQRGQDTK